MAFRVDRGELRKPTKRADGSIVVDGRLTRTGVFLYRDAKGGVRREYRPPSEVFNEDSLASFSMVPVTDDHPPEALNARNAKKYAVGAVGESVKQDGDHVAASLAIFDEDTILKMQSGKQQLSCGYTADLIEEPGISPEGEKYDAIQTNIRGNHVAIVDMGRAGTARVRMDGAEMLGALPEPTKENEMEEKLKEALAELERAKARADKAEQALLVDRARADKAEAELDAAKADKARLESERNDAAAVFEKNVRARVDLETKVAGIVEKAAGMTDRQIKVAAVAKLDGADIGADRSDEYVNARFDLAIERQAKADKANQSLRAVIEGVHNDAPADPEVAARMAYLEKLKTNHMVKG